MEQLIITLTASIIISFFCRTMGAMAHYCLTYGQVFGWVKLHIARKIDPEAVSSVMAETNKQSDAEAQSIELYDVLCDYKSWPVYPTKVRLWSTLLSLLDCIYCLGFWISFFTALVCWYSLGLHLSSLLMIPILSFFMIEKV